MPTNLLNPIRELKLAILRGDRDRAAVAARYLADLCNDDDPPPGVPALMVVGDGGRVVL